MAPETLGSALYNELRGCSHSGSLGSRNYIANSELFRIVTEDSIVAELKEHSGRWSLDRYRLKIMKELAGDILKSCPKLFATLVHLELPWGIKNLLDAGLTDEDLPLSKQLNCLKSCRNPAKSFKWPVKWKAQKLDHFVEKQWLLMAPTFCTNGAHTDLSLECPLPFKSADEVQNGVNNVLYRVSVDPSHHKGFEVESSDLEVALKEFRFREDFAQEQTNLNRVRVLKLTQHITLHFESFSRDRRNYIIFPWAEGGDLDNFWKEQDAQVRSPQLALWCLKQILGLAEALEVLHNKLGGQDNLRHGDLKPGNILNFLTGGTEGTGGCGKTCGILKITDFGISRIHNVGTLQRQGKTTTTRAATPSYQAPETEFKGMSRSRKFDIWSLGCIFLEFTIWFVRGCEAVERFNDDRTVRGAGGDISPFYQKQDNTSGGSIEVHPAVVTHINDLSRVTQSGRGTAFGELLDIIESKLLRIQVKDRIDAETLRNLLKEIFKRAKKDKDYRFGGSQR